MITVLQAIYSLRDYLFVQCNNPWRAIVQCTIASHMTHHMQIPAPRVQKGNQMSDVQRFSDQVQRAGKDGFDAAVSSFGEANKGFQAIAAEITAYSKKSFEDGTRAFEQLLGAKSFEQVIEIQSQYARMAYEGYVAELSKLGEMYAGLTRNAYKQVEQAAAKAGTPNRLQSA